MTTLVKTRSSSSSNPFGFLETASDRIHFARTPPIAEFWIPTVGVGKGRPKLGWYNGQVSVDYSEGYKAWKNHATRIIEYQSQFVAPASQPVNIVCDFINFASSDADNLTGSVLDAMNGVYLEGDSSSSVTGTTGQFFKTRKRRGEEKEVGILVKVYPGGVRHLEPGFSDRFILPEFLSCSPLQRRTDDSPKRRIGKKSREKLLLKELEEPPVPMTLEPGLLAQYWIPGTAVGKARPYLHWNDGNLYKTYSRRYTNWMDYTNAIIRYYSRSYPVAPKPAHVEIKCVNFLSSDIDNLQGSPLDCMSKKKVYLGGDSSSYLTGCAGHFYKVRKRRGYPEEKGMIINVFAGGIREIESGFSSKFKLPKEDSLPFDSVTGVFRWELE